jgi:predicted metal-dependent hydrolase
MTKDNPAVRGALRKVVENTYMKEAKDYLPSRAATLAAAHGFSFRRVSVSRATTRWGSCSPENNIRLSLHLMRLPNHLVDYVILHELCHTVEKNHGKKFWKLMDEHCNGLARQLASEVRNFQTS